MDLQIIPKACINCPVEPLLILNVLASQLQNLDAQLDVIQAKRRSIDEAISKMAFQE